MFYSPFIQFLTAALGLVLLQISLFLWELQPLGKRSLLKFVWAFFLQLDLQCEAYRPVGKKSHWVQSSRSENSSIRWELWYKHKLGENTVETRCLYPWSKKKKLKRQQPVQVFFPHWQCIRLFLFGKARWWWWFNGLQVKVRQNCGCILN